VSEEGRGDLGLFGRLMAWRPTAVGTTSDMLFSEGTNMRLELTGTRTLNSGIVMLSYQVPETGRGRASAAGH
jgi:hypothetical protein